MSARSLRYDVAIVGAGPVGSLCALAHARKGARVALLEAHPKASTRLAGEWLHPPAAQILRDFGISFDAPIRSTAGEGFVVFPEDRSEPIVLPYPNSSRALVCEHDALVAGLHEAVENEPAIDFHLNARVTEVEDEKIVFSRDRLDESLTAARIVGADGRASIVRSSLGVPTQRMTCSRMVGVSVEGVDLEPQGFGQVLLGGPGPILVYPLGEDRARIVVDVPLDHWSPRDRIALLADSYAAFLPSH